jgi:Skp family chaperone for outer membrane proteins
MSSAHGVKCFTGWGLLWGMCLLSAPALAQNTSALVLAPVPLPAATQAPAAAKVPATPPPVRDAEMVIHDLLNHIASHSRRLEQLLQEREALAAQLEAARGRKDKDSAGAKEQEAKLVQALRNKDLEVQDFVQRQGQLLSVAGGHEAKLEALENRKRYFRFIAGAGVPLYRFPDLELGPSGLGSTPGSGGRTAGWAIDAFGGVAFLPVDFNSRDRRQTFSLGGMLGLGGTGFPANVYTGLTLKVWILYLNAGFNFRKAAGENASLLPTQPAFWRGHWTPTFFAGVSLDSEALLALQEALPTKSSPEGLQVDPR